MDRRDHIVKHITAAILVTSFVYAFVNSISSVLVNEVIEAFSLTGTAQGLMSSMLNLGFMAALLVNPLFQGRIGKITMILISGAIQIVALLLSGCSHSAAVFMLAIVLLGMGCGWLDGYINSAMIDAHPADRPRYLGLLHGIFGVGSLLVPLVIQWMLGGMSWRWVHGVLAGMTVAAMVLVLCTGRKGKRVGMFGKEQEERLSLAQLAAYLKNGRTILLLLCAAMTSMFQTGVLCWIARYMLLAHNAQALGAACLTIFWVAATVNRFLSPRLRARPLVLILVGALLASGFLAVGIVGDSAVVMCVCMGLVGLTSGHFAPMSVSECAEGHQGSTTLTTSVVMFVMGITRVIVPLLMAALTDVVSVQVGMAFPIVAGILAAVFSALALRMKRVAIQ